MGIGRGRPTAKRASWPRCSNAKTCVARRAENSPLGLQFDGQRGVSVDLFRSPALRRIGRALSCARQSAHGSVGPGDEQHRHALGPFMLKTPLQTVVRSYAYRDYVASAMLLNLGKRGLRLREQYQWLPPARGLGS